MEYVPLVLFIVFFGIVLWTGTVRYGRLKTSIEQRTTLLSAAAICVWALVAHVLLVAHVPAIIAVLVLLALVPVIGAGYSDVRRRTEGLNKFDESTKSR